MCRKLDRCIYIHTCLCIYTCMCRYTYIYIYAYVLLRMHVTMYVYSLLTGGELGNREAQNNGHYPKILSIWVIVLGTLEV